MLVKAGLAIVSCRYQGERITQDTVEQWARASPSYALSRFEVWICVDMNEQKGASLKMLLLATFKSVLIAATGSCNGQSGKGD